MQLIVGRARTADVEDWRIFDLPHVEIGRFDGTEPLVLWPASYWPEIAALVEFDDCRTKLGLPPLPDDLWQ